MCDNTRTELLNYLFPRLWSIEFRNVQYLSRWLELLTVSQERWSLPCCTWKFFMQRSRALAKKGEEKVSKVRNALHVTLRASFAGMKFDVWCFFFLFYFYLQKKKVTQNPVRIGVSQWIPLQEQKQKSTSLQARWVAQSMSSKRKRLLGETSRMQIWKRVSFTVWHRIVYIASGRLFLYLSGLQMK